MKKLVALAVAAIGLTSVAHADSHVAVYGVLDAYVGTSYNKAHDRTTGVQTNGLSESRLGFKGSEDLGNGLTADFRLEFGPIAFDNADSGANMLRQGYIGLRHKDFGGVALGTQLTPAADWAYRYTALPGSVFDPVGNAAGFVGMGLRATDRLENAVSYTAPAVYGVTGQALVATTGEGPNAAGRQTTGVVSANWERGPFAAGVVYRNAEIAATPSTGEHRQIEYGVGASVDLQYAKVLGTYQQARDNLGNAPIHRLASISAVVPVTAKSQVIGGVSYLSVGDSPTSVTSYSLAYTYDLSKRTTVYGGVTYVDERPDSVDWGTSVGAGLRVAF